MIVGLTWNQLQACRYWGTPLHRKLLTETRQLTKRGHQCAMPPIGWKTLSERLIDAAFHPSGRERRTRNSEGAKAGTRSACHTVTNALAHLEVHPALRGEAMMGSFGNVLLVWVSLDSYSIYPNPHGEVRILVPHTTERNLRYGETDFTETVTRWLPQPVGSIEIEGAFLDPSSHLVFLEGYVPDPAGGVMQLEGPGVH